MQRMLAQVLLLLVGGIASTLSAQPFSQCPSSTLAADEITWSSCDTLITANANGTFTLASDPTQFKSEDALVGFQNNSGAAISAIRLVGQVGGTASFGFDQSAIGSNNTVVCPVANPGTTGYEGPGVTFSNLANTNIPCDTGTVNFNSPVAPGGSKYFFLERRPSGVLITTANPPPPSTVPLPPSVVLGLTGLVAVGLYTARRKFARSYRT